MSLRSKSLLNIFGGSIAFQDVARKISALKDSLNRGDLTKLKAIQEAILQMSAPMALVTTGHIIVFLSLCPSFRCITCWVFELFGREMN